MESGTKKKKTMAYYTEDLMLNILSRLPLKCITSFAVVCKEWKSILESQYLHDLFMSHHQNSHTSWSLMCRDTQKEVVAHYRCETWGLPRSLGSYISSFLTHKFKFQEEKVTVDAYTDVGLILVIEGFRPSALATRTENGVVSDYKIVLMDKKSEDTGTISLLIYSSKAGVWHFNTLHTPFALRCVTWFNPVSLNGNLYWLGCTYGRDDHDVVVSHNLYATGLDYYQCRVIQFPDVENNVNFRRACTTSQGSLMYMNIIKEDKDDGSVMNKLCVWRLHSKEWQIVSQISPACMKRGLNYYPLAINPFDANKMYLWSELHKCFVSTTNLNKGKFERHKNLECSSDGHVLSFAREWNPFEDLFDSFSSKFVLPRSLHRIPSREW
ncbi:PREDICTED: F-box protein At3g28330 [Camelina sativa]|uniref:F-box protein At3g28330 n=1 Tax=Camelina sativa TaxID=90675 RepID=A0ABM0TSZ1_CAMSA|nr:PREDICTED: F-box protein At3g28330 [Camelina sativa]